PTLEIGLHHVADERALHLSGGRREHAATGYVDCVLAEVGQSKVLEEQPAVRVRVGAHAPVAYRRQCGQRSPKPTALCEQLRRSRPRARARAWTRAISSQQVSSAAASAWWTAAGSSPSTKCAVWP